MAEPKLDHALLAQAVSAAGDRVLAELTASEALYYVESLPFPALTEVQLFRVVPLESSRPLDWLVARYRSRPEAVVTTLHTAGVAQVILTDPAVRTNPDLPRIVYELARPRAAAVRFVDDARSLPQALRPAFVAPTATADGQGAAGRFQVLDEGRLYEWSFEFSATGPQELRKRALSAGAVR